MRKRLFAAFLALIMLCSLLPVRALAADQPELPAENYPLIEEDVETPVELEGTGVWKYFRFVPKYSEHYYFESSSLEFSHRLFDAEGNVLYDEPGAASYTMTAGETYIYATTNLEDSGRLSYTVTVYAHHEFEQSSVTPATCTEYGQIVYTCDCGATYSESIPPQHQMVDGVCTACGEAFVASGKCGLDVTWGMRSDGTLTILGEGEMWDYLSRHQEPDLPLKEDLQTSGISPWEPYREDIVKLEIAGTVTQIGENAFEDLISLKSLTLPEGVKTVGNGAFRGATALTELHLPEGIDTLGSEAFAGAVSLREVRFPASVTNISNCLTECTSLEKVIFDGDAPNTFQTHFYRDGAELTILYHSSAEGWDEAQEDWMVSRNTVWYDLDAAIAPGTFAFDRDAYTVEVGDRIRLRHNADSYVTTLLNWSVNDPSVCKFVSDGILEGLVPGTVTVTAASEDGSYSDTCTVTVVEPVIPDSAIRTLRGTRSSNAGRHNYTKWDSVNTSFIAETADGGLERVQYISGTGVVISRYDSAFALVEEHTIQPELGLFGGFYAGEQYNFLLFGKTNRGESDSVEVLRIVKYTKDWERLEACSIHGANTTEPFHVGTADMAEQNGVLYLHTCHEMYTSDDGINHQANMTFVVDQQSMELTDYWCDVMNIGVGYCSHSFGQVVEANEEYVFRADHGDAYPRGFVLTRSRTDGLITSVDYTVLLEFRGQTGENATGASLGGMALSTENALVVGNSVDHAAGASFGSQRNIFLAVTNQETMESELIWLTNHSSGVEVRTPQIVKVSEDRFLILWEQYTNSVKTHILLVDGDGKKLASPMVTDLRLSDCQPICTEDGLVTWYVSDSSKITLYQVSWKQLLWEREEAGKILGHDACPFTDVKKTDFFYEPVLWAVEKGVTTGMSATKFAPGNACTRGQIVTFLWRAAGEPEPTSTTNPFRDVKKSAYYYKAVLWAVENGITTGMGNGKFSPDATCTRAQSVTFLYRASGEPEVTSSQNPFRDVKKSAFYYDAVLWAVENGITTGMSATEFGPNRSCTRGQIVTFLYRNYLSQEG